MGERSMIATGGRSLSVRTTVTSSSRLRVYTVTSPSRRWIWTRAPSSFASKTPSPPRRSSASATPVAVWASIGPTGRPTRRVNSDSALAPPARPAAATAGRSPPSPPRSGAVAVLRRATRQRRRRRRGPDVRCPAAPRCGRLSPAAPTAPPPPRRSWRLRSGAWVTGSGQAERVLRDHVAEHFDGFRSRREKSMSALRPGSEAFSLSLDGEGHLMPTGGPVGDG